MKSEHRRTQLKARAKKRQQFSTTAQKIAANRATMHARNLDAKEQ